MNEIALFKPDPGATPQGNVEAFIHFCRTKIDLYGADLDWGAMRWDVTERHRSKGRHERKVEIVFGALGSTKWQVRPMADAFVDFAKAYLRYYMNLSGEKIHDHVLGALRVLEAALMEEDKPVRAELTDELVAERGKAVIERHYSSINSRYKMGSVFERLLNFVVENGMVDRDFEWKSPFRPELPDSLVGDEFAARRAAKLPSRETLEAVGAIFHRATDPRDVIVSSCIALLHCAPGRISECVTIQNRCLVWLKNDDGTRDLSLRWYPVKRGRKGCKDVLKVMEPVALEAVRRVRELTDEARRVARWYENNPDKLYLPNRLARLRDREFLNSSELGELVGIDGLNAGKRLGLTVEKTTTTVLGRRRSDGTRVSRPKVVNVYRFKEVEAKILELLPPDFPWMDRENRLKYSDALFVVLRGALTEEASTMPCMFMPVSSGAVVQQYTIPDKNIFERFGFQNPDGSTMVMQSKQARHWLNTLAEKSGLSDLERDLWSGRMTARARNGEPAQTGRQSLAYLHNSTEELMAAAGLKPEEMDLGSTFEAALQKLPITFEEFQALEDKPTVHVTEFGLCYHDFVQLPCPVHADCLNCMEHACMKGDREKADRIRRCLCIATEQLEMARQAVEEDYLNGDRWYQHQALTQKRLSGLVELLDDDTVPADAMIMLVNPFQYSAFRNAITDRAATLGDEESLALALLLEVPAPPLVEECHRREGG